EKYLAINNNVTGFSFANLGLFTGFAGGIVHAVYSLVLLGIFKMFMNEEMASAAVGVYAAIYAAFAVVVGIFSAQILRWFTKTRLLYIVMATLGACYCMMSFSVKPSTFIMLDYVVCCASTMFGILLPLFMSDFSKGIGMEKLNARYLLWVNIGAFVAPVSAMAVVNYFDGDYRMPLLAAGMIYFSGLLFFKHFGIVQEDKVLKPVNVRRTFRALRITAKAFFKKSGMLRAYVVNFGFFALRAMRYLYVPIVVIENGFSNETLGVVLSIGIIPYIVMDLFIGRLIKKYGVKLWLTLGFVSFGIFSLIATFASGYLLLSMFVLWQISGAFMEACHDLLFFNDMPKTEQPRFYGVFRTSVNFPSVVAPLLGMLCIAIFGTTSAVWIITAIMAVLSTIVLWSKH
ncbi:MAG: MFS transporter, partial [Alphaproteobacteria bacterium]|nr:MFS transporter [Alphaproteobacteria bacterium]